MATRLKDITNIVESLAPKSYAYKWDNVGLQLGSEKNNVEKILITLEVTNKVLDEAMENNVDMIITHHPMIFSPLKNINKDDFKGNLIYKAIQNNISIYTAHTNIDIAPNGLNDYLVKKLSILDTEVLDTIQNEHYYKLVVFIPVGHEKTVSDAISDAGAGHIGNYSNCTFRTEGIGTFKPLEGTEPFIGNHGEIENVEEVRLETIVPKNKLNNVLNTLIKSHPYEEVAYDIYPLENEGHPIGLGRVGKLDTPKTLQKLVEGIKKDINVDNIKVAGDLKANIKKVAVINGSGADLIKLAKYKGCDCVITGDVKYHDAQDAISQGINVIDIGHYDSEKFFVEFVCNYLKVEIEKEDLDVQVIPSTLDINPFVTF